MLDSEAKFLSPEEARSKLRADELKAPEVKDVVDEKLEGFSPRQRKYALLCLTHSHLTEKEKYAMAGYAPNGNIAPAGLKKISGKLGELLLEVGITGKDLAEGIRDAMTATKLTFKKVPIYDKNGKVTCYEMREYREPDRKTRDQILQTLIKSGNYLPGPKTKKHEHEHIHKVQQSLPELRQQQKQLKDGIEVDGNFTVEQPVTS